MANEKPAPTTTALPPKLGAPAERALAAAGIRTLDDLATWNEADLARLHGVGPNALAKLRAAMAEKGLNYASESKTGLPRVIFFNMMTLDGFFADPEGGIEWHNVDDEFNRFAVRQLAEAGTLVFGRVTYELMASYWPTPEAYRDDPEVTEAMNRLPKIVASRTLSSADWHNTRLVRDGIAAELNALKQKPGGAIFVFGSADLSAELLRAGVIDELRVMVAPLILGEGRPLFPNVDAPVRLKLLKTRAFSNGNVLLYYEPER